MLQKPRTVFGIDRFKTLIGLLLVVIFLLPFERIPSFKVHGFTIKLSYLVSLLVLMVAIMPQSRKGFGSVKASLSDKLLGSLWLVGAFSLLFSPNRSRSLVLLLLWAFVFSMYFITSRALINQRFRGTAEKVIMITTLLVCIFGLYQFIGDSLGLSTSYTGLRDMYTKMVLGFPRIQSVALEPLYFSNYLLVPLFIFLVRYIQCKNTLAIRYWIAAVVVILNIILGISRGAYIALLVSGILFMIYVYMSGCVNRNKKLLGLGGMLVVAMLAATTFVYGFNGKKASSSFSEHASIQDTHSGSSVPGRLESFKIAITEFSHHPLVGNGLGSFGVHTASSVEEVKQHGYGIVNNEYLELLSETGLLGLGLFLGFLLTLAYEVRQVFIQADQVVRLQVIAVSCGLVGVMLQYNFFSTLSILYIWVFLGYLKSFTLPSVQYD